MASPTPVLPLVGSTMVSPGFSSPRASASSIMLRAMRSFTLPAGLSDSSLPSTSADPSGTTRRSRTRGVLPPRSSTLSAISSPARIEAFGSRSLDVVPSTIMAVLSLLFCQVCDGHALQDLLGGVAHPLPHLALDTAAGPGAGVRVVHAGDGRQRSLQRHHHLAQPDLPRIADEGVATLRAAHAAGEAGAAQGGGGVG